jgi:hypothetical protein
LTASGRTKKGKADQDKHFEWPGLSDVGPVSITEVKRAVSSWFGPVALAGQQAGRCRIRKSDGGLSEPWSGAAIGKRDPCTPALEAPLTRTPNLQPASTCIALKPCRTPPSSGSPTPAFRGTTSDDIALPHPTPRRHHLSPDEHLPTVFRVTFALGCTRAICTISAVSAALQA